MLKLFITNIKNATYFCALIFYPENLLNVPVLGECVCTCAHSREYKMMPSVNKKFCFFLSNLNAFNLGAFFQWLESLLIKKPSSFLWLESTACCCSVAESCPTLCNPMDSSTPGFPVLHTLLSLRKLMSLESVMPSLEVGRLGLSASFLVFGESTQPFTIKYVLHQVGEMPLHP